MAADRVQTLRPLPLHPKITLGLSTAIDTNMTQNGGQQSCKESPEESEKASMQLSALLCCLLQTSQVPPPGLTLRPDSHFARTHNSPGLTARPDFLIVKPDLTGFVRSTGCTRRTVKLHIVDALDSLI